MNKKRTIVAAIVLALLLVIGGTLAYFTDTTDEVKNTFTLGKVNISLAEPGWVAANGENLMPGQTVAKAPTITVESDSQNALVFAKVEVPCLDSLPLFTYDLKQGWTEVSTTACTGGKATHVYGYGSDTALESQSAGATLVVFEEVTLANLTDTQAIAVNTNFPDGFDVTIKGYAIQAEGLTDTAPATVWGNFA